MRPKMFQYSYGVTKKELNNSSHIFAKKIILERHANDRYSPGGIIWFYRCVSQIGTFQ